MQRFTTEEERAFLGDIDDDALMVRGLESYLCLWFERIEGLTKRLFVDESCTDLKAAENYADALFLEFQMVQVIKDCVRRRKRLLQKQQPR